MFGGKLVEKVRAYPSADKEGLKDALKRSWKPQR